MASKLTQSAFYGYYWYIDEKEKDITSIRAYGLDENNKNICVRINDFTPYIYLELPQKTSNGSAINWKAKIQSLGERLDDILKDNKPIKKKLQYKHKLYGAEIDKDGNKNLFPYLLCSFSNKADYKNLYYILKKPIYILGLGQVTLKMHEQDASEILQLVSCCDIPTCGWVKFVGKEVIGEEKITICYKEYIASYRQLSKLDNNNIIVKPKIMGFDIEVNSTNPSAMPQSSKPGDKIFQISCVFSIEGEGEDKYDNYLLTLGEVDPELLGDNVNVYMFESEADLLEGFTELVREQNPNIIVGYNILKFDIQYMIDRAKSSATHFCFNEFAKLGFHKDNISEQKKIKWSSSAFKNQEFDYLDAEGRVFVDLLPLIQRDYKFNNYQLKTVSKELLNDTKDDLSPKGIFKCYRIGIQKEKDNSYSKKAIKAMSLCGKYCLKDSILVVKLMDKLQAWVGLAEMAKTTNICVFDVFTQGQQKKVYSQIYKYCMYQNIVVEKDAYITKENERYVGAHVFPPVPGNYERVLPFDFCLSGDTLISMSNGTSKRIDQLSKDRLVLGFNKKFNVFENYSFINGLQKKGIRHTVKIYFQDGSSIVATPEHKFMLDNGEWCQAKDLKNKYVKAGIKFPEDKICELEEKWQLDVDGFILNMKNDEDREKSLAFTRMLGYILSDGSIYESTCNRGYTRKCVEASFGTMYDALTFKRDINLFSDVDVKIRKRDGDGNKEREKKGTTLSIAIPGNLSRMFHSLEDIVVGKRATQEMKLPKFILDDECPLSIIREFLGGLFGGDGIASCLSSNDKINTISFKWAIINKYINSMNNTFIQIKNLLEKFELYNTSILKPIKINYTNGIIKPSDYLINPRYDIQINLLLDNTILFMKNIGFRYCINKYCKSYFASMYLEMKNKTRSQRIKILDIANNLIDVNITNVFSRKKDSIKFIDCLDIARDNLLKNEPTLYEVSFSSSNDLTYDRHERIRHPDKLRKYSLHKKKFPSPIEYFKDINVLEWFEFKKYLIKTDDINIPSFRQKVIDVREHEPTEVFDIEVDDVHNFLANGITVSNCSLYPTTIIAYNIDYSSWVTDQSIPDEKCNVFKWRDCYGCGHDPKVIKYNELSKYIDGEKEIIKKLRNERDNKLNKLVRQNFIEQINNKIEALKPYISERSDIKKTIPKNPMCEERYYRFLKEPKGVVPTILQNLLDARKNTRKQLKENQKSIKDISDDKQIRDLDDLNKVLDKRQLAYKICANSVASTTPIPCRINGSFIYKTIEEISKGNWKRINEEQEVSTPIDNLEVWSDLGFTKPKYVMRHPKTENLFRVNTHTGSVDCTGDHSLLRNTGKEVKPKDLKIGEKLLQKDFPLPLDTPKEPLFLSLSNDTINDYILSSIEEEMAFVHGVFFAEGSCGTGGVLGKTKSSWIIYNQDFRLLERCKNILNKVENETFKITKYYESAKCFHLVPTLSRIKLTDNYRNMFYDNRKYKKFPDYIFNASFKVRQAFFMGYYNGDGNRNLKIGIIMNNKGNRGSASLFYLAKSLGYKVSISYTANKNFIYRLQCCKDFRIKNTEAIKKIEIINEENIHIEKDYIEYVYDIETENHHFAAGVGNMIVHNSMYGILGVKKGLLPFMAGAMCLYANSLISYSYGFTRKMKDLTNTDSLWTYNNGQVVSNGNGLIYNGKREIVKITLIDGRTLKCTPDHKIMTPNGWIEAGKLLPKHNWDGTIFSINDEYSKVIVGLELPEDIIGEDEKNWKLLDYTMDTPNNREKMLAFCRILGFILADGSISGTETFSSSVAIGTLLDAKIFVSDIKLITDKEPLISDIKSDIKGNVYSVHIPSKLVKQIVKLDGIVIGRRICQPYTIPSFLFDSTCPLSVVREFLGGLFGGDGTSPSLSVAHPSFSLIQLGWLTIEKYKDDMENTMNKLINLLLRFDIKFWLSTPRLARVREGMVPKDIKENPRWEYLITTNSCNTLLFAEKIGFRYCSDKNNKLTVASSYQRYSDNVRKQHINLILKTSEMYDLNNKKLGIKETLIQMRKEVFKNEIPLHEYISLSKSSDVNNHRSRPNSLKDYKLLEKYFLTAREYTKLTGCEHWFLEKKGDKKVYSMERKDVSSPCFYLDVIDIRYDGVEDVYDIIDIPNHSFMANGIVVHNCTTFMGRTNIEIVADTITKKYGGKLVYGDMIED